MHTGFHPENVATSCFAHEPRSRMTRFCSSFVAASLWLILTHPAVAANRTTTPPNVLFILVDDLGWSDTGFMGSRGYETPHVDQLEVRYFSPHYLTHMKDGPEGEYLTDRQVNETINFIQHRGEKPFFAFLSFDTVHTPLEAKTETIARYDEKFRQSGLRGRNDRINGSRVFQNVPAYAAMVEHLDENVDIGEQNDLAATKPEMVNQMKRMLRQWLRDTSARIPDEDIVMP